jgi:hypothetical protein
MTISCLIPFLPLFIPWVCFANDFATASAASFKISFVLFIVFVSPTTTTLLLLPFLGLGFGLLPPLPLFTFSDEGPFIVTAVEAALGLTAGGMTGMGRWGGGGGGAPPDGCCKLATLFIETWQQYQQPNT